MADIKKWINKIFHSGSTEEDNAVMIAPTHYLPDEGSNPIEIQSALDKKQNDLNFNYLGTMSPKDNKFISHFFKDGDGKYLQYVKSVFPYTQAISLTGGRLKITWKKPVTNGFLVIYGSYDNYGFCFSINFKYDSTGFTDAPQVQVLNAPNINALYIPDVRYTEDGTIYCAWYNNEYSLLVMQPHYYYYWEDSDGEKSSYNQFYLEDYIGSIPSSAASCVKGIGNIHVSNYGSQIGDYLTPVYVDYSGAVQNCDTASLVKYGLNIRDRGSESKFLNEKGDFTTIADSVVTGVKGNSETSYRVGNVNLTPNNIGAAKHFYSYSSSAVYGWTIGVTDTKNDSSTTSFINGVFSLAQGITKTYGASEQDSGIMLGYFTIWHRGTEFAARLYTPNAYLTNTEYNLKLIDLGDGKIKWYLGFGTGTAPATKTYVHASCIIMGSRGVDFTDFGKEITEKPTLKDYFSVYKSPYIAQNSSGVGSATKPVYVDSTGRITACNDFMYYDSSQTIDYDHRVHFFISDSNSSKTFTIAPASLKENVSYQLGCIRQNTNYINYYKVTINANPSYKLYGAGKNGISLNSAVTIQSNTNIVVCRSGINIYIMGYGW